MRAAPVYVNWDPAETQRVTSGLLAKYPQIDATFHDSGEGSVASLRAFDAAGRPLPLTVTEDVNSLGCLWQDKHASNPDFNIITTSSGTWMVRWAVRKAVAAAEGLSDPEPSIVTMLKYEDLDLQGSGAPAPLRQGLAAGREYLRPSDLGPVEATVQQVALLRLAALTAESR